LTTYAQNDTCYTKEENRRIAEKLIEGENLKKDYEELRAIVSVQNEMNDKHKKTISEQQITINQKDEQNGKLQKKVKRKNTVIIVLFATFIYSLF
jgi:vacuolar-type H+-ATPase subunit I/STV1